MLPSLMSPVPDLEPLGLRFRSCGRWSEEGKKGFKSTYVKQEEKALMNHRTGDCKVQLSQHFPPRREHRLGMKATRAMGQGRECPQAEDFQLPGLSALRTQIAARPGGV